jgi:hypothetical protein
MIHSTVSAMGHPCSLTSERGSSVDNVDRQHLDAQVSDRPESSGVSALGGVHPRRSARERYTQSWLVAAILSGLRLA